MTIVLEGSPHVSSDNSRTNANVPRLLRYRDVPQTNQVHMYNSGYRDPHVSRMPIAALIR